MICVQKVQIMNFEKKGFPKFLWNFGHFLIFFLGGESKKSRAACTREYIAQFFFISSKKIFFENIVCAHKRHTIFFSKTQILSPKNHISLNWKFFDVFENFKISSYCVIQISLKLIFKYFRLMEENFFFYDLRTKGTNYVILKKNNFKIS